MRYVLLRHNCPPDYRDGPHWDLMLERDGVLVTWSLLELPAPEEAVAATRLADHRVAYLDYEGPVSGDRGEVSRVAQGELVWSKYSAQEACVRLLSGDLAGELTLTLADDDRWTLAHSPATHSLGG
ncbi:ATP-dependent DNA ligase [Pirellulimonas nuda]|uniref:ATP-dependent DNA ligase n=1 Tax=Pirellulimonas nuda TaxID=2528009 RepID=A0A518DFQ5_9BACT|nr:DNA polymerase ligase N-terminal domain-containing protein [Pirellulimonas nuda]QDU90305.1 ATP-dependent DNA ligase [Pirellulimonas nuda]